MLGCLRNSNCLVWSKDGGEGRGMSLLCANVCAGVKRVKVREIRTLDPGLNINRRIKICSPLPWTGLLCLNT